MGALRSMFAAVVSVCGTCLLLGGTAGAFATVEPPPKQSPSSELPDGRVYELVSPANKHGNQAGAEARPVTGPLATVFEGSVASPDGDAVAFKGNGPAAETNASGLSDHFVAEHIVGGWKSRSTTARFLKLNEETAALETVGTIYSPDLSHVVFSQFRSVLPEAPNRSSANIYLMGSNPLETPTWLLRSVASPSLEEKGGGGHSSFMLGMTPDASVVYFAYAKPLLPEDETREGWGIYESRHGLVSEVGVLPDGSVPNGGALPAANAVEIEEPQANGTDPASLDNQISEDGRRLFFVSAGQLYVHMLDLDGSERSMLISASQLPGHVGEAAPAGVSRFENRTKDLVGLNEFNEAANPATYAYASPDGSHVVFQSMDQLTGAAPANTSPKVYDFDVDTDALEYLPDVSLGGIVTSAKDGSSFLFVDGSSASAELKLWTAGPGGGSVRPIVQLPAGAFVGPGRMVAEDSVIVFQAQGPVPGVANSADEQIYRYDVRSDALTCISCPPSGTVRSGNAYLAIQDQYAGSINESRGVSSDGRRIFFATPNALVSRDVNGDFDTYEWENGSVFLISSGTGTNYSPFLDNSESGGDVFFATAGELVQGDNDQSFDVYDARIPRPGDNPPPSAVPCSGDVCQGPPSVAQLLGAPPSATFDGAGNIVQEPPAKSSNQPKVSTRAHKLAVALRVCRRHKRKPARLACEKRERRHYAASRARFKSNRGGSK